MTLPLSTVPYWMRAEKLRLRLYLYLSFLISSFIGGFEGDPNLEGIGQTLQ
jgi:hypothetical protein